MLFDTKNAVARVANVTAKAAFFRNSLPSMKFLQCMIELIKNARQWGATIINIVTHDKTVVQCIDNGKGISESRVDTALGLGHETGGPNTASLFDSGLKRAYQSIGSFLEILTSPVELASSVIHVAISKQLHTELWGGLDGGNFTFHVHSKTRLNWPFPFTSGTRISIRLSNPKDPKILRGDTLARALSRRLPTRVHPYLRVDDKELPEKRVIGSIFSVERVDVPELGTFQMELHRLEDAVESEDTVRFSHHDIGEVTMTQFLRAIGAFAHQVPDVYRHPAVSGTIVAPFLKEHIHDERDKFKTDSNFHQDHRLPALLKLLRQYEGAVTEALRLQLDLAATPDDAKKQAEAVFADINAVYGEGAPNNPPELTEVDDIPRTRTPRAHRPPAPLTLSTREEHGVGEVAHIALGVLDGIVLDRTKLVWHAAACRGENFQVTADGATFIATTPGRGKIYVDLPDTPYKAEVAYNVVEKRVPRLSCRRTTVVVGSEPIPIMVKNADLVSGKPKWVLDGSGELIEEGEGLRATFYPKTVGVAYFHVTFGSERISGCIEVKATPDKLLRIRDTYFRIRHWTAGARQLVRAGIGTSDAHVLNIDYHNASYVAALKRKHGQTVLKGAIAAECARFMIVELGIEAGAQGDPLERRQVDLAVEILAEII